MKEIKTKECNRAPKLKNPVSRMPKELMRDEVLRSKEKYHDIPETYGSGYSQESPTGYAGRKVESTEERGMDMSVRAISTAGRILVKKPYEKMCGYGQEQPMAKDIGENAEGSAGDSVSGNLKDPARERIKEKVREKRIPEKTDSHSFSDETHLSRDKYCGKTFGDKSAEAQKDGLQQTGSGTERIRAKISQDQAANVQAIKARKNQMEMLHSGSREEPGKPVKPIFHNADGSVLHTGTIRTGPAARADQQAGHTVRLKKHISAKMPGKEIVSAMPKKQAEYAARASRQMAVKSARAAGEAAQSVKKTARIAVKGIVAAIKAAVSSTKALTALAAAGGGLAVFLILVTGVIGGVLLSGNNQSTEPLSQEVVDYAPVIQRYARQYGIPDYVQAIQAIMMQESRGQGSDPMQASECPFNTRYANSPWLARLRRPGIRSTCDAVLFRWKPVCRIVREQPDGIRGNGAGREPGRPEVLVMVWIQRKGGMVRLFCIMVRGSVWVDHKRGGSEVCILPGWCGMV